MRTVRTFSVAPLLPKKLKRLGELAHNLWWAWNPDVIELFRRLDSDLWEQSRHDPVKLLGMVAVVAGLIAATMLLPVKECLQAALDWTGELGPWGPVIVAAIYIPACVLMLPGLPLTLGAGMLFGLTVGTVAVSIGSTAGACAAFLVGRTFGRGWIQQKVARHPKFAAIDEAVGREGFKIVLLTRLSPIFPFNLLNYAYGLTRVKFTSYALASWIGMLPATVLYVYMGSAVGSLAGGPKSLAERVFFFVGLGVALLIVVFITRVAQKALRQQVASQQSDQEEQKNG